MKIKTYHIFSVLFLVLSIQVAIGGSEFIQESRVSGDTLDLSSPAFSPEDEVNILYKNTNKLLESFNPIASNSGTSELVGRLTKKLETLQKLSEGMGPNNKQLSNRLLKQAFNIKGADKITQLREAQKKLNLMTNKFKHIKNLGLAMSIIDPGSKVLGAFAAGDYAGTLIQIGSGGCKFVTTSLGGGIGGVLGTGLAGPGVGSAGGVILGAGAADYWYETNITPHFDALNQAYSYTGKIEKLIDTVILQSYNNIDAGGASLSERIEQYMKGEISIKTFRSIIHPIRDKIHKKNAKLVEDTKKKRKKAADLLRKSENKKLYNSKLILRLENGELTSEEQNQLLMTLKKEHLEPCKHKVSRDYVSNSLKVLSESKLVGLNKHMGKDVPSKLFGCLCGPGRVAGGGCKHVSGGPCWCGGPLGGGGYADFVSDYDGCLNSSKYDDDTTMIDAVFDKWNLSR